MDQNILNHFSFFFHTRAPSASSGQTPVLDNLQGRSRESLVSYYVTVSQSVRVHATIDGHSLLLGLLADAEEQGSLCHSASERQCSLCAETTRQDEVVSEREVSWTEREADSANLTDIIWNIKHDVLSAY